MWGVKGKTVPGHFLLGSCLFFLLLHFLVWPLAWQGLLLPHMQKDNHGFRVESYRYDLNFKVQDSVHPASGPLVTLDKPLSFLSAYSVWQVSQKGIYRIRLSGEGREGLVLIDGRPVISLRDLQARPANETQKWLSSGPHLLELRLRNRCQPGRLLLEADGPGQIDQQSLEGYEPQWRYPGENKALSPEALFVLELGNIDTWLVLIDWGEYVCLFGALLMGGLGVRRLYSRHWAGKIFPTRRWKIFFLGLGLVILLFSSIFHLEHPIPPIWSDGLGYYAYLPSYLIYHDLSLESIFEPTRRYAYPSHGLDLHPGEGFVRHPGTGRYVLKYPLGTAVMEFPFFLLAHLISPLLGSVSDGFSLPYQLAVVAAAAAYTLLGLIFLLKLLSNYFSPRVVLATLLSLFLGTNLLAYAAIELSMSHVYSFCLVCLLLLLVPRWTADPSWKNSFFLGLLGGMIPLVRNTNVLCLLLLPLYGITDWNSLKEKIRFLWGMKIRLLFLSAVAVLVFSPQILIWKITTDRLLVSTYTYPFERFYFLSPSVFKVLFSPHNGLFIWAPILFFSIPGFFLMKGPLRVFRLSLVICLLLQIYLVSSWYLWSFGWSFGHRAFVDFLGMFAVPLACFYGWLRHPWAKKTLSLVGTFLIALTCYWFIQYLQGVLMPGELRSNMTWTVYKEKLLNPQGPIDLWHWIKNPKVKNGRLIR